jgi:hypothetical protein
MTVFKGIVLVHAAHDVSVLDFGTGVQFGHQSVEVDVLHGVLLFRPGFM